MAGTVRKLRMKEIPLSEVKDDLSHFLRKAEKEDIIITRHGETCRRADRLCLR